MKKKNKKKISIIGLGYVGLPLALEFAKHFNVVGFDINKTRIKELNKKIDSTNEVNEKRLFENKKLHFSCDKEDLIASDYYIITVPTPVDSKKNPNLNMLRQAAKTVGTVISKNCVIILESTVYPGITEGFLCKIIENESGLKHLIDFNLSYSPERINPGDKKHKLVNIKKIVAADTKNVLIKVSALYNKIIKAGIHKVSSIKAAEMSKAIENAQRDINIAFINEIAMISKEIGVDSYEVIKAAKTKWNFLDFQPGLVGGHCIGVDPYYLAKAALSVGYDPEIILAGRKINDRMPKYIVSHIKKNIRNRGKILILGLTFKENVTDIRNSKSAELYNLLVKNKFIVDLFDPHASRREALEQFNIKIVQPKNKYDCIIVAVAHHNFKNMHSSKILSYLNKPSFLVDIKNVWHDKRLPNYIKRWSL